MRYGILLLAQIAVGAAAIFARFALGGAGALGVSASRMGIAAAVLLIAGTAFRRPAASPAGGARPVRGDTLRFACAGIALAAHFALWIWSLEYTGVAVSTLLVATTPVWTALYDAVAFKRMLSPASLGAMALGGAGMYYVVRDSWARPPVAGHETLGALLAVAGAIAIGAYFLIVRTVRHKYGTRAIVTRTYSASAVVLILAAALAHQAPPALNDVRAWLGILGMALVSQLVGHTALNAALRWFSPSAVAFTSLLEPVAAALLALAIFGERLGALAIVGAIALLGAVAVFLREDLRATLP
ncbi:MAG TPA: DMT family transporter [Candidatus Baltobacteraceae bacterium]|nr:DMT family transporter [Candidatus Baltobacteraceae bacterium]